MDWREHHLFGFFLGRLKSSAAAVKRRIWLLWHSEAGAFHIHDGKSTEDDIVLGWTLVAYCDRDAEPQVAPKLGVVRIPGAVQLSVECPSRPPGDASPQG